MRKILYTFLLFPILASSQRIGNGIGVAPADSISAVSIQNDSILDDSLSCDSTCFDSIPVLSVKDRIERLLDSELIKTSQAGIMAYDLTSDSLLFAYNERQTLRPASTMKLLTAITALDHLGGDYQFSTWLKYRGEITDTPEEARLLLGDLIVKGGMDPKFGSDDMRAFVETLQKMRIDTIYGSVIADRSFKDTLLLGEGWCWDDKNPVLSPLLWNKKDLFLERFQEQMAAAGIVVSDSIPMTLLTKSDRPTFTTLLCTRHHTIEQVFVKMMKESDNLFAEAVFYNISANAMRPATARLSKKKMEETIRRAGITHSNYRIADGSGLSLYNYQSAEMQVALLKYAYRNSNIFESLYPSLPIAGIDGTLKKRMRKGPCLNNVRAKTGTLTGVSSLAGYLTNRSGHLIAFSIINQGVLRASKAKAFQDAICNILAKSKE